MILVPQYCTQTLSGKALQLHCIISLIYTFVYLSLAFCRGIFVLDITQYFMKMKTLTHTHDRLFTNSDLLN